MQEILIELDAPLLMLGTWVSSIVPDGLKMAFKLEPKPDKNSVKFAKDVVKVEIIAGWAEAS